eukprot:6206241-Pleurochrysis_carterae.AAC.1
MNVQRADDQSNKSPQVGEQTLRQVLARSVVYARLQLSRRECHCLSECASVCLRALSLCARVQVREKARAPAYTHARIQANRSTGYARASARVLRRRLGRFQHAFDLPPGNDRESLAYGNE